MTPFFLIEARGARVIDNGFGCHPCGSGDAILQIRSKAKKIREGIKETNEVMAKEERIVYSRKEAG